MLIWRPANAILTTMTKALLQLAGSGEEAAETGKDLDDPYIRDDLGLSGTDAVMGSVEECQVFPWEGKPLLYARTLSEPRDLVIDDALFGGREPLTDYDLRLWDADIIYTDGIIPYTGEELIRTRYNFDDSQTGWWSNGFTKIQPFRGKSPREKVAGDCTAGAADRNIYASYVGFPTAGGTGSSFTLHLSMGISAASEAKEGAWAFVRTLLLPYSNVTGWYYAAYGGGPASYAGLAVNRETFEEQMRMEFWTDPYTGELFRDRNGDPMEFSPDGIGAGRPGDIVLMAYLFAPTEAQMDRFWRLYESTQQITGRNDALLDIVMEQADVYFAGDKSLEETAKLIQNRAQLYVSEHQ